MKKEEVLNLMGSSKDSNEWNSNCDKVKAAHNGGYPDYWYTEVVASGLINKTLNDPSADEIKIISG